MILQVREIRVRKESKHSPWYKQLYLPVCERLIGQLQFRFNQASLVITTKGRDYLSQSSHAVLSAVIILSCLFLLPCQALLRPGLH